MTIIEVRPDPGSDGRSVPPGRPRIVIVLENLPVERDRRVWRQARALVGAGLDVTVICPAGSNDRCPFGLGPPRIVDGVEIRAYRAARERSGMAGFVWEYGLATVQTARAVARCRKEHSVDGIQVCNPPDVFFPLGWWARRHGIPFVFDQHDLTPELFLTRFGHHGARSGFEETDRGSARGLLIGLVHRVLLRCERETYLAATRVIATNRSYRRVAVGRGSLPPGDVAVVRNGPDPVLMRRRRAARRPGLNHLPKLVVWMGNMGPQDGVEDAVRSIAHLVNGLGRTDTGFVFIGTGETLDGARDLARRLGVADRVVFTGWIPDEEAFAWLSTADVGLSADPPGPLNDMSTMNKTLEYMSFGLPVVAHDLHETRVSLGRAGAYAETGDPEGLARCLDRLLDDPERRARMGRDGRRRIEHELSWPHQAGIYVDLWSSLVGHRRLDLPLPDAIGERSPVRRPQPETNARILIAGEATP